MEIPVTGPHADLWHVYRDGVLIKVFPKQLFHRDDLFAIYQTQYPQATITIR